MPFIEFQDVTKRYRMGETEVLANHNLSFSVERGEFVVILGPSGAGKSTLLNILGGMDTNEEGAVWVDGENISTYNEAQRTQYRREKIGFVFQNYNLIANLTAKENVEMATHLVPKGIAPEDALRAVGLSSRMDNFPAQLSGGEQQRVAIARAMAKRPALLLCDEPTGALDYNTGRNILQQLHDTCRQTNTTVIIVTHNALFGPIADRVIEVQDAKVRAIHCNAHPASIDDMEW